MKIFSIKEVIEATNGFLKPNSEKTSKKNYLKGDRIYIKDIKQMFIKYSKQKTALVTDKNKKISYVILKKKITKLKKIFGKNKLLFIPGNSNLISITSYLACLESDNACLIYDKYLTQWN